MIMSRAYLYPAHFYSQSFRTIFTKAYNQISALTSKPIAIAETATLQHVGNIWVDKPIWIAEFFRSVTYDFPRVNQITFFILNKLGTAHAPSRPLLAVMFIMVVVMYLDIEATASTFQI